MLGRLARWLRIMGIDVEYASSGMNDTDIIHKCLAQDMILLTRDRELHTRYQKSLYIESQDHMKQLGQFISTYHVDESKLFSRCPQCNTLLERIETSKLKGAIPDGVIERFSTVLRCSNCGKFYWEGDHFGSIVKALEGLGIRK